MSIEKIKLRIIKPDDTGMFHDSRKDSRTLGKAINMLIDKVNELVEANNQLQQLQNNKPHTHE